MSSRRRTDACSISSLTPLASEIPAQSTIVRAGLVKETPWRFQTSPPTGAGTNRLRIPTIFRPASTGAITSIASGRQSCSPSN